MRKLLVIPLFAVGVIVTGARAQGVDQRAADCTAQADAKGLQGEERFAFRARCKASGGAPTGLPATPNPSTTSNQPTTVPSNPTRNAVKGAKRLSAPVGSLAPNAGNSRSGAVQLLASIRPDVSWREDGVIFTNDDTGEDNLVGYNNLEVTVNHYLPFGAGPEQLYVGTTGLLGQEGYRLYSGSYDQNKAIWDRAIVALRTLGTRVATPSGSDKDIRSVRAAPAITTVASQALPSSCPPEGTSVPFNKVMTLAPDFQGCIVTTTAKFLFSVSSAIPIYGLENDHVLFSATPPSDAAGQYVAISKSASDSVFLLKSGDLIILRGGTYAPPGPGQLSVFVATSISRKK